MVTSASGESMTGVPATTDMHFRNGAVAISYVATLLLRLVDEKKVSLDDKLSKYLPDIPHADRVTLRQLAQMTSGYPDYVIGNDAFAAELYDNPFRQWEPDELLSFATSKPLLYEPGTNWNYAHTNYVLLGRALEKATGEEMPKLLTDKVLEPLGLSNTANSFTPEIPPPVLHAFTAERRAALKIAPGTPFFEESTFWNPSWTITHGAIQTTNITDLAATAAGIGSGRLLSPESYRAMVSTDLRGRDPHAARLHHLRGTERPLHLRTRHRDLRRVVAAEPDVLRLCGGRGVSAVAADRDRDRGHLRSGRVRRAGQLLQRRRQAFPQDRSGTRPRPRPAHAPGPLRPCRPELRCCTSNASRTESNQTLCASMVVTVPKVLFIYNDPITPEALLGEVFTEQGFDIDVFNVVPADRVLDPAVDTVFPDPTRYDVVVPLGSRWSVHDDALRKTWVGAEMQMVRDATAAGVGVLGVCFGGQLVAQALGGTAERSAAPELGWYPVESDAAFIAEGPWFQWHSDRWTTPPGATEIARNASASQAFVAGTALALQFHPELDGPLLEQWLADHKDGDLVRLGVDADELRAQTAAERQAAPDRLRTLVAGYLNLLSQTVP